MPNKGFDQQPSVSSSNIQSYDTDLVLATLKQAHQRWALPETCIFHSDRGSQYTAKAVTKLDNQYHWQRSFSALGKPGDNAWSESFFAIMKKELIYQIQLKISMI
ncbi:IS3 family transposase [Lactiplantibacillus plantarum]|nr:IS3 family transposase [Lactiplantibacillus plantarum]